MKTWMKFVLAGLLLVALAAGAALFAAWRYVETPLEPGSNATTVFRVETGEGLRGVSARLEGSELIRHAEAFRTYGRYRKLPLQAGEFELSRAMSPRQILETLAFGKPILYRLSFAEGLTMREVAQAVNATGLTTGERFLEACRDRDYLLSKGPLKRLLVWVGARSYAIYLIHIPAFFLTREIWFRLDPANAGSDTAYMPVFAATALLLILIASELNYRFIEMPLRRRGVLLAERIEARSRSNPSNGVTTC